MIYGEERARRRGRAVRAARKRPETASMSDRRASEGGPQAHHITLFVPVRRVRRGAAAIRRSRRGIFVTA